jgi:hypothetical protein
MAIILPILTTFNAAGVRAAQSELTKFGGAISRIGKSAIAATAAYKSLNAAIDFVGESIASARDLERNMAALSTVFGTLTPRMEAFTKNAATMGLSQVEAARTSVFLGSVLKQAGFSMEDVADNTERLTSLAQDLATTYGYDTSEALTAMTALFRGEYDPIEKFGVALKQNEINALLAARGMSDLTGQEMLNAQQQIRMEQLFLRSADAMGAYERQAGTLFVAQKNLNAAFENMKALAGGPLTNDLAKVFNALTPMVTVAGPQLQELFANIGDIMVSLVPLVEPVMDTFSVLTELFTHLAAIIEAVLTPVIGPLADILNVVNQVMHFVLDVINALMPLIQSLAGALEMLGLAWDVVAAGLENVLGFLKPVTDGLNKFFGQFFPYLDRATNSGIESIRRMRREIRGESTVEFNTDSNAAIAAAVAGFGSGKGKDGSAPAGAGARNSIKDFYDNLKDELAKQNARLVLETKGLSNDLIESIIGSGEDWKKVFNNVKNLSRSALYDLQSQFRKTSAGQKEVADLQKKLEDQAEERYQAARKLYEDQLSQFEAQRDAITNLRKALSEAAASVIPLGIVTREIGQFESAAVSAFENIADTITRALADGTLLKSAADNLTSYANKEKVVIAGLMRQRDEIVNKRSLAQAMLDDVKAAIVGVGNITTLLQTKTEQITQSVSKMVGNITVITSKTIEQVTGGGTGDLVSSFTDILAKTKTFAEQLKQLRALGLDKNLYQQIVDAGIDAGGQTAKAILDGGAGTVGELNSIFDQLNLAGAEIAKTSAEVMYGAGVDLTDGLINGLISQEQKLVDTATQLANSFMTAFNSQVNIATPMPSAPTEPVRETVAQQMQGVSYTLKQLANIDLKTVTTDALWKDAAALAKKLIATPEYKKGTVVNVTVKADVTTNGKTAGQAILAELNKYAKANS